MGENVEIKIGCLNKKIQSLGGGYEDVRELRHLRKKIRRLKKGGEGIK